MDRTSRPLPSSILHPRSSFFLSHSNPLGTMSNPTIKWPAKHDVFGVRVSATSYDEVVTKVIEAARAGQGGLVDFMDVNGLMCATGNPDHNRVYNGFDILAPDGQPVRWALNYFNRTA